MRLVSMAKGTCRTYPRPSRPIPAHTPANPAHPAHLHPRLTRCREAVTEIAKILYSQHDPNKDKPMEVEISCARRLTLTPT